MSTFCFVVIICFFVISQQTHTVLDCRGQIHENFSRDVGSLFVQRLSSVLFLLTQRLSYIVKREVYVYSVIFHLTLIKSKKLSVIEDAGDQERKKEEERAATDNEVGSGLVLQRFIALSP